MSNQGMLVFIHGSGDSAQVWEPLIEKLRDLDTVALELPGHGALADRAPMQSIADYTNFTLAELARRGIEQPTLVGHSLGGAVALQAALAAPASIMRLVLVGSGARLRVAPAFLEAARTGDADALAQFTRVEFAEQHASQADDFHAHRRDAAPGALYHDLLACNAFDVMEEAARITQPMLLTVGAEDRMTPPKYAEFLAKQAPQRTVSVIPGAGHYVQLEQPQLTADALRLWLAGQQAEL